MSFKTKAKKNARFQDQELGKEHERFRRPFQDALIGIALVAPDGAFLDVNPALCKLLGRSADELRLTGFQPLTHPDDLEADLALLRRTLAGEIESYEIEKRYLRPDGSILWAGLYVSLIRDEQGEPLNFVSQIVDIGDRKQAEGALRSYGEELRQLALTDPLSGLASRKALELELRRWFEELAGSGRPEEMALALIEIEQPEASEREEGEVYSALRRIGEYLREYTREGDLAARAGERRLALMMPQTSEGEARGTLVRLGWKLAMLDLDIRVRSGVAAHSTLGGSPELLVSSAEADLLAGQEVAEAKGSGLPAGVRQRVRRLLHLARERLGMDIAVVIELAQGGQIVRAVDGDQEGFGARVGDEFAAGDSYGMRMVEGRIESLIPDTQANAEVASLGLTRSAGIRSYIGVPLRLPGQGLFGVVCFASRDARPDLGEIQLELVHFTAGLVGDALAEHESERATHRGDIIDNGIRALLSALDARDHYTGEHSAGVVALAGRLARRLGLPDEQAAEVEQVALLHDIGKVGIPDSILQKRGELTEVEWDLMREHPAIGERIVAAVDVLAPLAPAVRAEHERYDGTGYPDGLAGEEIPIAGRITLACDAYHAMISERPYRAAMSESHACEELRRGAGSQFDPSVVRALLELLER